MITGDEHIDAVRASVAERCFTLLARQQPVASDLRAITTAMATVGDLERMCDLAKHIAKVARMRFPDSAVPQEVRPIFLEAGFLAESLVAKADTIIAKRDVAAALELEADDDLMDRPHGIESAIDITLLGRYYEPLRRPCGERGPPSGLPGHRRTGGTRLTTCGRQAAATRRRGPEAP